MTERRLTIGLSLSPTWLRGDAWRRQDSRVGGLADGSALIEAAVIADRAGIDAVFKPDSLALDPVPLADWPGQTGPDPAILLAAVARETRRIGLIPTYSATFAPPYLVARELQTLDQISGGRAAWNVVTSLAGAENLAAPERTHEQRYADAADVIDVVRALHASYPAAAVRADPSGVFADPSLLRTLEPRGRFAVRGPLTIPAAIDAPMPLLHAGGSHASIELAASRADAVFAMTAAPGPGITMRAELASRAEAHGRPAPRVLPGLVLCLADDEAEAAALRRAAMRGGGGAGHWTVVGTPESAVDEIARRWEAGAIDGFIALPFGSWRSIELLADAVVPRLVDLGLFLPHDGDVRGAFGIAAGSGVASSRQ
ncbi:LLM class flavin-dependent oxidoreductase [Microbacterium indicum]|uniref:LLM class flavin-dependent oxidoreductase n=1 Tax=Microbacterium indicum TaxID=358100 RepID=UPI00040C623D|nr:LLM class flavin-dependent oxidoreductase [Microbacterium indicum]